MSRVRLTVRRGPKVSRERFDDLEAAIAALRSEAAAVTAEGGLEGISALRDFEPSDRVAARLEVSVGGWRRGRAAGVDVMGDGSVVPFAGQVTREPLAQRGGESAFDAVQRALSS